MIVYNNFEWDVREASACRVRHGVSFKEATTVLEAESVQITEDPVSGACRAVGPTSRGQVLVVLYKPGPRIRILDAAPPAKPAKKAAAAEPQTPQASEAAAPTQAASEPQVPSTEVSPAPEARVPEAPVVPVPEPVSEAPSSSQVFSKGPASDSPPSAAGWDAATYEIYWDAYSAARKAAREQGKSPREAQRIGREAGERAVRGVGGRAEAQEPEAQAPVSEPAPKSSKRSTSWRAAARAVK